MMMMMIIVICKEEQKWFQLLSQDGSVTFLYTFLEQLCS